MPDMKHPDQVGAVAMEMVDVTVASIQAPEVMVLDHVHWTVHQHDYWVIGGSPGSGKSDLLATAAGLVRPSHGVHRLLGQELSRLREEERLQTQLRVGVVFGSGGRLFNHLTVAENLGLAWCYHHNCHLVEPGPRVEAVLEAMELSAVAGRKPSTLNRNLQQRTALARALVLSPELLFLDNAEVGTGPRELRWWLHLLNALHAGHPLLQGQPLTLVVGTNDLDPWTGPGRKFALTHARHFSVLGTQEQSIQQQDPALRELLPADWLSK
jgi:ABC-type transporter Mla maintaining outer membrane lipid asymmetry ATPase subunit MlaF